MDALKSLFAGSKVLVHVLVCVFAISSWVDLNGMWVELPIFVTHLPEQWSLPSYITILGQIANIGPIIFFILAYVLAKTSSSSSSSTRKMTLDKATSYVIMLVGMTATLLLAFFWRHTGYVFGSERSVALLTLSFFLSVMDCTSSVAYVAFMSSLKPVYLPSYFIGEGLSGLLPAMMALGQGAGDIECHNGSSVEEKNVSGVIVNVTTTFLYPVYLPPHFSVHLFFLLLGGMILMSFVAFCLLNNLKYCKDEFVTISKYIHSDGKDSGLSNPACTAEEKNAAQGERHRRHSNGNDKYLAADCPIQESESPPRIESYGSTDKVVYAGDSLAGGREEVEEETGTSVGEEMTTSKIVFQLVLVVVINFLITSFLLSIQTYSSLPYGIETYDKVVTLSNIANPVASLISMFLAVRSLPLIVTLVTLGCTCGAYIITAAALSPQPPLVEQEAGGPVAVLAWVGASFFLTYAKVSIAGVLRHVGRRALIWYGAATQVGALIGAVVGFVLVNEVKVFEDASWC